jgi:hypothetical protein
MIIALIETLHGQSVASIFNIITCSSHIDLKLNNTMFEILWETRAFANVLIKLFAYNQTGYLCVWLFL